VTLRASPRGRHEYLYIQAVSSHTRCGMRTAIHQIPA